MTIIGEPLFWAGSNRAGLSDVLRHNLGVTVPEKVDALSAARFAAENDDALVASVVAAMRVEPLALRLGEADADVSEVRVVVRDVFGGTVEVPGRRIAKVVPFDGDSDLFDLRPDSWSMNPPRGEVRRGRLVVGMEVRESGTETAMHHIDQTIVGVGECIASQRPLIEAFNLQLEAAVRAAVSRRRGSLAQASDIAARLRGR